MHQLMTIVKFLKSRMLLFIIFLIMMSAANALTTFTNAADTDFNNAANWDNYVAPRIPTEVTVLPTSEDQPQSWRYTTTSPPAGWEEASFNDSSWLQGNAGFGTVGTPGLVHGTDWSTSDIWLRRDFTLSSTSFEDLKLRIYHDQDAEVYINGILAGSVTGWTSSYTFVDVSQEARAALMTGTNTIAGHCHQTSGGTSTWT